MPAFRIAKSELLCYYCGNPIHIGEDTYFMPHAMHKTCGELKINRKKRLGLKNKKGVVIRGPKGRVIRETKTQS